MANFALAFGERRFPPPPERFCGRCAIGRETRRQVAETAKAKKISRKILRIQKEFLTLQRFSPLLKKEPRKEHIERFTIDKSSTRAFVRAAGRKAAQARTKNPMSILPTIQHPNNKQRFGPRLRERLRAKGRRILRLRDAVVCGVGKSGRRSAA